MTGNALRRAREFLGYTQPTMAKALKMSLATYQRREALAEEHIPHVEGFYVEALVADRATTEEMASYDA